jgi:enoyl-CoA hydratase/carnithine racemase
MYQTIRTEKKDRVVLVTLNRPDKLNSVNLQMRLELSDLLDKLEGDDEVRAVVVTGAGRAFCAGADISEFGGSTGDLKRRPLGIMDSVKRIYEFSKPMIGAINGVAAGDGSQWVLAFDLNVASEKATFAWPATNLGILCPYGIIRLPKEIGRFRAKDVLMTCRYITAEEAYHWGLLTRVVPHEELIPTALELANSIAKMPPLSIRAIKEAVNRGMEGYEYASQVMANLQRTEDFKEGVRAFMEKREPHFEGK